jgi:hypothetical protein
VPATSRSNQKSPARWRSRSSRRSWPQNRSSVSVIRTARRTRL